MRNVRPLVFFAVTCAFIGCGALVDESGIVGSLADANVADAMPPFDSSAGDTTPSFDADDDARSDTLGFDVVDSLDTRPFDGGGDAPPDTKCSGDRGLPVMVRLVESDGGAFCIDRTEVTSGQYAAFVTAGIDPRSQPAYCAWNDSFAPKVSLGPGTEDYPVLGVDWCDAYAYCKWANKRLCGKLGGGVVSGLDVQKYELSQWVHACEGPSATRYPYGSTYDRTKCNGDVPGGGGAIEPTTKLRCEGGYPGVYDLVGNVWEWVDSCDSYTADAGNLCFFMGGAYNGTEDQMRCDFASARGERRYTADNTGFRCCADD